MSPDGLDLKSLQVLAAVLDERHVGRAARALGMGQPAVSYHLARLRELFGDPLVVRDASGVRPTPRAMELETRVRALLSDAAQLVEPRSFDPRGLRRELRIASLDYERVVLLAQLVAEVQREAPDCRLALLPRTARDADALADGSLDLVVGPGLEHPSAGLRRRRLYQDSIVCVGRADHPLLEATRPLTLAAWASVPHVTILIEGSPGSSVDAYLARRRLTRRVIARVAGFHGACEVVARTDALALLPASMRSFAERAGLAVGPAPIEPRRFDVLMLWHASMQNDPAHVWLRGCLVRAASHAKQSSRSNRRR